MSHVTLTTTDFAKLTPCDRVQEILPGDKLYGSSKVFARFAPLASPAYADINAFVHSFYIPTRIIWPSFKEFISGPQDDRPDYVPPEKPIFQVNLGDVSPEDRKLFGPGSLLDYLGYPVFANDDPVWEGRSLTPYEIDMIPVFGYYLIWREYYRDQNLTRIDDESEISIKELPDGLVNWTDSRNIKEQYKALLKIRYRCWEKDYFTSALPWPQKGPDVQLPLSGDAEVYYDENNQKGAVLRSIGQQVGSITAGGVAGDLTSCRQPLQPNALLGARQSSTSTAANVLNIDPNGALKADLSTVNSTTINELRRANALQRWLERNALGGNRYIEYLYNHWFVRSSDRSLQRPQYLGGGRQPIVTSEVLQMSQTTEGEQGSPLGHMAGQAATLGVTRPINQYFEEYGYVYRILSILPRTLYMQGMPRMFTRKSRFDYATPEFAHIGEQEVKNQELYFNPAASSSINEGEFGYQSRYAEYKYIPSSVHGDMRTSLAFWHLGRMFGNLPGLNEDFVTCKPEDCDRIFAVQSSEGQPIDHIWVRVSHSVKMTRKLPYYGTPY